MADQRAEYEIKLKDSFSQGFNKIDKNVDSFEGKVDTMGRKTSSLFAGIGKAIGALGLAAAVKNVVGLGVEMEQTRVSFTTFLGSAEKANKAIADLNEFSNVTPFDNAQVIKAGKGLLAFGTAQEELIPTLKAIGDISAGTGKDFNELATIYGKARVAGTLYAEDINQLVEAGVPIMGEFAKALGVTEGEVKKLASEGKLKFADLETAFQNLTGEGGMFFDLMAKQSETVGGRFSTLLGKIQTIGIAIGEAMLPALGALTDFGLMLVENTENLKLFATVVGIGATTWGLYQVAVNGAAWATKAYTGFQLLLNAALNANPIGIVVIALGALTTGFVVAYKKSQPFRAFLGGLLELGKQLGTVFIGVGKIIGALMTYNYAKIPSLFEEVKSSFEGLGGAFERGRQKVLDGERDRAIKELTTEMDKRSLASSATAGLAPSSGAAAGAAAAEKTSSTSSSIAGSSPKNVTLNITKLIETINFNNQQLKQSSTEMTEAVKRALLTALNDVAIVQS